MEEAKERGLGAGKVGGLDPLFSLVPCLIRQDVFKAVALRTHNDS